MFEIIFIWIALTFWLIFFPRFTIATLWFFNWIPLAPFILLWLLWLHMDIVNLISLSEKVKNEYKNYE